MTVNRTTPPPRRVPAGGLLPLLLITLLLGPKELPAQQEAPPIKLDYNYVVFGTDENFVMAEGKGVVEFSFSFPESSVRFGSRGKGVLVVAATFTDRGTGEKRLALWPTTVERSETLGDSTIRQISTLERITLPGGEYRVDLKVYNVGMEADADSTSLDLVVPRFSKESFAVADIEFLDARRPADGVRHRFRRGEDILFRNLRSLVTGPDYYLHAYTELYNQSRLHQGRYHLYWVVVDSAGQPIFSLDSVYQAGSDPVAVLTRSFNLATAPTGLYYLLVRVYDGARMAATDSASSIRSFFLHNPQRDRLVAADGTEPERTGIIDPMFAGLTEEELDLEFAKAAYIVPEFKQDIYRGLSGAPAKARFLTGFWRALDDDPTTAEHPFQTDYYERVKKAGNFYRSGLTPKGWDSDRGRVLLKYGEPDAVDRHPNDFNRKPFEIWSYSASRMQFIFVDVSQTGNYLLVHSSAPGELRNPNWEREFAQMHDDPNEASAVERSGWNFGE